MVEGDILRLMPRAPEGFYDGLVLALVQALEWHKSHTSRHALNVTVFSIHLSRHLGSPWPGYEDLFWGALLHDVGKLAVPQRILQKTAPLTPEEKEIIRLHPVVGHHILENTLLTQPARNVVLFHHERWDGKGYPLGLAGKAIPLEARICAVADAFEAMTSDRPYRKALSYAEASARLCQGAGTQFDPALVDAFLGIDPRDWVILRNRATLTALPTGNEPPGGNRGGVPEAQPRAPLPKGRPPANPLASNAR